MFLPSSSYVHPVNPSVFGKIFDRLTNFFVLFDRLTYFFVLFDRLTYFFILFNRLTYFFVLFDRLTYFFILFNRLTYFFILFDRLTYFLILIDRLTYFFVLFDRLTYFFVFFDRLTYFFVELYTNFVQVAGGMALGVTVKSLCFTSFWNTGLFKTSYLLSTYYTYSLFCLFGSLFQNKQIHPKFILGNHNSRKFCWN